MATIKYIIGDYISETDGKSVVNIRITQKRRAYYLKTPFRILPSELTAKGDIKSAEIKRKLRADIATMDEKLVELGTRVNNYSAKELGEILQRAVDIKAGVVNEGIDFISYGYSIAREMKSNGRKQGESYISTLHNVEQFIGKEYLDINSINKKWLKSFDEWLFAKPMTATGVNNTMRMMRAIYNKAREEFNDEERGEIQVPFYPFGRGKYQMPEPTTPESRALDASIIRKISDYVPSFTRDAIARDVFMLSFYLMGMNAPDIYRCTRIENNRIIYIRSKVEGKRGIAAEISVKVPPKAETILKQYSDKTGTRVFDFYKRYTTAEIFGSNINKGLKVIGEAVGVPKLSLYYARHSFATIAHSDYGASISDVGNCLNHVTEDNCVTLRYTKKDYTRNDEVQAGVIAIVFEK